MVVGMRIVAHNRPFRKMATGRAHGATFRSRGVDSERSHLIFRKFWLGPSYARPWNFPDPSEAANSENGKPK